ncbi:hypothetical protein SARC_09157 [Sphaeroforma arctica JP610]|uniref:Uncharacterized protein n=1 Tax=Sphaeroforma arctica JP610 TaxID=667725 RepID=A0A0L0FPG8_9EUKA|nr:hypothetical protein SARC_09157 [Sphaeroforma arctica JP610]KNC78411.1 hypothetical protein SARC_09157 [Sphaeroforma arctica JP610]|eukprot:XP_014152313.1 hypothetical protein SARC_09157 [Sphaeroforma arctica JP610]
MGGIASPTPIHPLRLSQSNRERSGRPAYKSMSESIQEAPPPQRPPRRCSAAPDSYSASNPRATTRATVGVIRKQRASSPMTSKRMTPLVSHLSEPEVAPARPPRRSALPPCPSLPSA